MYVHEEAMAEILEELGWARRLDILRLVSSLDTASIFIPTFLAMN